MLSKIVRCADQVSERFNEIEDAINWINTGGFDAVRGGLTEDEIARFSDSAIARLGRTKQAKMIYWGVFRSAIDSDPNSPTFNTVNPKAAQRFLDKNAEALEPVFPDVFDDIRRAVDGRLDLMICWQNKLALKIYGPNVTI